MNLNKVFVLGRLTSDPQIRTTTLGQSVSSFSIATNRVWNDKSGQSQDETEYHNIVAWGRQADIVSQFLKKGSLVLIEGRLKTRSWQDSQGQNRKTTEIICERLQLGPRPAGSGGNPRMSESTDTIGSTDDHQKEELPEINIGDGEIKSEDLPF